MIGYYYTDSGRHERLYVPFNFIAVKRKEVEVILAPDKISKLGAFIRINKASLDRGLIARVEIDDNTLDLIQDSCFSGDEKGAGAAAQALFEYVRRNWRKISVRRWE
ncbi:MAG: hypothetical protein KKB21_05210 [Nanoarchaeota archaeon]|nr:hypothetical protein [Nanoarchaeota archaeon]MBU4086945.1 hypothetical protein [Nanoarchaeota archaeon]